MRNADSWGLAFIVFGTAGVMWALPAQPARVSHSGATQTAVKVPTNEVAYKISVSTKRIPSECKSLDGNSAGDLIARCQAITSGETQMTMVPVDEKVQVAEQP
jgi:hypothetical protein